MELTLLMQQYGNSMIYALGISLGLTELQGMQQVYYGILDMIPVLVIILFLCGKRQKKNGNLSKKCRISENGDIAFPGNS